VRLSSQATMMLRSPKLLDLRHVSIVDHNVDVRKSRWWRKRILKRVASLGELVGSSDHWGDFSYLIEYRVVEGFWIGLVVTVLHIDAWVELGQRAAFNDPDGLKN
jgi:hypothetical protein